jgi:hypothetical protein
MMVLATGLAVCLAQFTWAAPMGTAYTYQGRLIEGDEAGDGLYDFAFKLFDDPCTGTQQGSTFIIDDLDVIDGYFTAELDFGAAFDGNARWLEIDVRSGASVGPYTTLIPRQEVTPTPYALYAQKAQDANTVDGLHGTDLAPIIHSHNASSITSGTLSTSRYTAFSDLSVEGYLGNAAGDIAQNNGLLQSKLNADLLDGFHASSFLTTGTDYGRINVSSTLYEGATPLVNKYLGIGAKATDSDRLDGLHASSFAGVSHSHNTLYFTEAESDSRFVNVTGDTMSGKLNVNTAGSGIDVDSTPTSGTIYGINVNADQSAANNSTIYGLYSDTDSAASTAAIYGTYSNATGNGYAYGVYGYGNSSARSPYGLFGTSTVPSSASTSTYGSYGVYATTTNYGTGTTYGAYNQAYQNGTSGTSYGTYSYTRGSDTGTAYGIFSTGYKQSSDTSGTAYGGYFTGDNDAAFNSYGIYSRAIGTGGGSNYGVYGYATGGTSNYAIYGYAFGGALSTNYAGYFNGDVRIVGSSELSMLNGSSEPTVEIMSGEVGTTDGSAIYMYNSEEIKTIEIDADAWDGGSLFCYNSSGTRTIQINGDHSSTGDGRIVTQELQITGGSDLSEQFDIKGTEDTVKPGMLVSIDPKRPGKLLISNASYDKKVAGIISGAGGVKPGMMMGQEGSQANGDYPVALTGRVYCWADASSGAIEPGDLLTTSSTPGHAMKVSNHNKALGSIIGKAMTSLEQGKGLVLVLVSLQ